MSDRWIPNPRPFPARPPRDWPAPEYRQPSSDDPPVEPESEPPPGDRRTAMILGMIGVALAAAVVTYLVLRVIQPPEKRVAAPPGTVIRSSSTSTTTTLPTGSPMSQAELDALTRSLVPFIEETRQLKFTSTPRPVLDDDAAYTRAFRVDVGRDDALMRRLSTPFEVLGLNPNDADLAEALRVFHGDKTVAFYDTTRNELHVRAVPQTPYVSAMLVVALTEELDDQHFTTDRVDRPEDFGDETVGLRTLVEGDGWRVANTWISSRPPAEQSQAREELEARRGGDADTSRVPSALSAWLRLPVEEGVGFTSDLVTAKTSTPLDAAFKRPPDGSAQVTSPARFQAPIRQLAVAAPAVDGEPETVGIFGRFFLHQVLQAVVPRGDLALAMSGYRGDALVSYEKDSTKCIRMDVSTGNSAPDNMAKALKTWASERTGTVSMQADAKREGRKVVRLDVCTSGGGQSGSTTTTMPSGSGSSSTVPGGPLP